ncbi:putative aldehyde dehydrogenase [Aspergillus clavatus NRRL 1]|uniref:aldehyde dehydrogenase (NAD(+)) n=1 Tax=Aspergillus clavatus (strain ATCC 1007 / CBS 513.65 / DSM 816 / NCTC 3887 / NRRL 1 / QM 1276 / 107) TaxID=344612 RepID=A1CFR5_ASPCL|nr:aldehyde dehydrogenase, putative [Aspergillus clavatus NRRL 1]EAW11714.1 aldehyde dehydrogenase, putative [Aspergillus clavatus NRRL 1]
MSLTITGSAGRAISLPTGLFIHNEFTPSSTNTTLPVENPTTGDVLGTVSAASEADVDRAVTSATTGFATWRSTPGAQRAQLLLKLADLIERDAEEFASIEAVDAGILFTDGMRMNVPQAVANLRYYAGWADKIDGRTLDMEGGVGYTYREPLGVCAAIVPWNAPLMITIWKLAPALATGNALIIKTSENSPLYGLKLALLIREAGFPPGVVNILTGPGSPTGHAVAAHPLIRKVAFTGSAASGRRVLAAAAHSNLKKVSLELGGKGPSIVFDDCDLENALFWTRIGITANNGQTCAAGSRIYVHERVYHRFLDAYAKASADAPAVVGDPLDPATTKGPIVNAAQHRRILGYIAEGKEGGARLLFGGGKLGEKGYFVENTAFADVAEDATIMKEEIFGPVASIAKFSSEDEVVRKANDSLHGLSAAIFTNDVNRAYRVSRALESGQVTVNAWAMLSPNAPFGGVKESGFGRDMGEEALEGWTAVKTVKYMIQGLKL